MNDRITIIPKIKLFALAPLLTILSSDTSVMYYNWRQAICMMQNSAKEKDKESLMFFACDKQKCIFTKSRNAGQADFIFLSSEEFFEQMQDISSQLNRSLYYGFAHTHPDKSIKLIAKKIFSKLCQTKNRCFLLQHLSEIKYPFSLAPSIKDLIAHKSISRMTNKTLVSLTVDARYLWVIEPNKNTLAYSEDEHTKINEAYNIYQLTSARLFAQSLNNNGLYPKNSQRKMNEILNRLGLRIRMYKINNLCK